VRPTPAPAAEPAPASPASLVGGTVLCVDDETAILDGMQTLLERWGMRVLRAGTAEEARRAFMQHSPDVVLADYRLGDGDCDGLELLQSLRAGGAAHAPAALVTADHGPEVAERARVLGYKVLRKPVKPAALRGLLGALLATASRGDVEARDGRHRQGTRTRPARVVAEHRGGSAASQRAGAAHRPHRLQRARA
jgi:CheY-like chemotaxis protein